MLELFRQVWSFAWIGLAACAAHYGVLVGLVEGIHAAVVPATLAGYVAGGVVSYALNRSHTFKSGRPHEEAGWRFAAVAGVGFVLTYGFMHLFVDRLAWPYLPAQALTTLLIMVWSFGAHKFWTFRFVPPM